MQDSLDFPPGLGPDSESEGKNGRDRTRAVRMAGAGALAVLLLLIAEYALNGEQSIGAGFLDMADQALISAMGVQHQDIDELTAKMKARQKRLKKQRDEAAKADSTQAVQIDMKTLDGEASATVESGAELDSLDGRSNPYWHLPNRMGEPPELNRVWSASEEETWRLSIVSSFPWQRYKTVQQIHKQKLTGSDVLLWDALEDEKFWIRARALMALGDFGVKITNQMVYDIIQEVRPLLVENFIKRFVRKASFGEVYVLRQLIRLLPKQSRLLVLKTLANNDTSGNENYFIAATYDRSPQIKEWAQGQLSRFLPAKIEEARLLLADLLEKPVVMELQVRKDSLKPRVLGADDPEIDHLDSVDIFEVSEVELYDVEWDDSKTIEPEQFGNELDGIGLPISTSLESEGTEIIIGDGI